MLEGEKFSKLAASSEIISSQPLFNQPTVQRALETSDARALTMLTMFAAKTMALSLHWRIERQSIKSANPCIGRALMSQYHTSGWYGGTPKSETMSKTMPQKINCIVNMNIMVQGGDGGTPKCIEKSKLCDGHKDCQDGADEKNACCKSSSYSYSSSFLYSSSSLSSSSSSSPFSSSSLLLAMAREQFLVFSFLPTCSSPPLIGTCHLL